MLRVTAKAVVDEFSARNITFSIIDEDRSILRYEKNGRSYFIRGTVGHFSSASGVMIANNKIMSDIVARELNLKVPETMVHHNKKDDTLFLRSYKPIVVKPTSEAHGRGVSVNITTLNRLSSAVSYARSLSYNSKDILLQQQVTGDDIRVLVIGYEVAAASQRIPAFVTGDGVHSLKDLILHENKTNQKRGNNYSTQLNYIDLEAAKEFLGKRIDMVAGIGQQVQVCGTANIGTGGVSRDITDILPTKIKENAIQLAQRLGLPVCGVDFIAADLSDPSTYYFIEVNASPSFGLHLNPYIGKKQDVAAKFVDYIMEDI